MRRSTRAQRAAENARFMGIAGVLVGIVIGVLIGIKYNIGSRPPVIIPASDFGGRGSSSRTESNPLKPNLDSIRAYANISTNQEPVDAARLKNYSGPVETDNPLRGLWKPKYNSFGVLLNFTGEKMCEVFNPDPHAHRSVLPGQLLENFPCELEVDGESAGWTPVEGKPNRFQWPDIEVRTTYQYANRDGTEDTGDLNFKVLLFAALEGRNTPQDTDDFVTYEIQFPDAFFKLNDNAPKHTIPVSLRWERRMEISFRDNPDPQF